MNVILNLKFKKKIFGTSRQLSLGTDSIIALLTASAIFRLNEKYVPPVDFHQNNFTNIDVSNFLSLDRTEALVNLCQTLTFFVAIIQLIMFLFQLGFLSIYLSDPLIGALTSGASIHIIAAQFNNLFGISLVEKDGLFKLPKVSINEFINTVIFML